MDYKELEEEQEYKERFPNSYDDHYWIYAEASENWPQYQSNSCYVCRKPFHTTIEQLSDTRFRITLPLNKENPPIVPECIQYDADDNYLGVVYQHPIHLGCFENMLQHGRTNCAICRANI